MAYKIKICGIYKITNPKGSVYIGQSVHCKKRIASYKNKECVTQHRLLNSLLKYGVDKHKFDIIHTCTRGELNYLEKYYVDLFQCYNSEHGLNLKDGGGSKGAMSNETKLKISIAHKGRFVSDSTRDKIRNFNLGKKHSEETKLRMSLSHKGKNTWMKGSKLSEETKLKISKSNIGKHSMKRTKILI